MYKLKQIIEVIEEFAPLSLQEKYDNSGLQVGSLESDIKSVLITTDITEAVVDEAISIGANLIISHHPLLFHGLKHITPCSYIERVVYKAIKYDIALYSAHTNLDKCAYGVSYQMAKNLGLEEIKPLEENELGCGLGAIGTFATELSEGEVLRMIKSTFNAQIVRHSRLLNRPIKKVAMCGGSGAEFIGKAIELGADLYLTADMKYHEFFAAENQIVLADIGHFESEQVIKEILYTLITKKYCNFAVAISHSDINPICYV